VPAGARPLELAPVPVVTLVQRWTVGKVNPVQRYRLHSRHVDRVEEGSLGGGER